MKVEYKQCFLRREVFSVLVGSLGIILCVLFATVQSKETQYLPIILAVLCIASLFIAMVTGVICSLSQLKTEKNAREWIEKNQQKESENRVLPTPSRKRRRGHKRKKVEGS